MVKRYAFSNEANVIAVKKDGGFVHVADYDALAARLAGTQDLYVQACEQRDDALALLTKVSLRKSCEGTQPYICHGLATARARLAEADALIAKGLAVVHDFLPNIGRCVLQDYQRMNEFCSEAAARTAVSASACLGGAPHWWDINANTGLPECRLCHKSPDPSAKESL